VSLLRKNEIPLLRTDQRGTITIVSNGRSWNLVSSAIARRKGSRGDGDSDEAVAATSGGDESRSTRSSRP
jgi:hypothetical protein